MTSHNAIKLFGAAAFLVFSAVASQAAPFMIVGNDEKQGFADDGKPIFSPAGKDSVLIIDLANPLSPKIVANLPLKNSVVGPPVNVDIDPTGSIAIVADSMDMTKAGEALKPAPDDKIYVIDLKAKPAKLIATLTGGKQPSGLSINAAGTLALVANRAGKSISILSIKGTEVKIVGTVDIGEEVSHVVFTPDGKHALATKFAGHKVAQLDVDGEKVTDTKHDLTVGLWPYNIAVTPNGTLALTTDNGNQGTSDGNVDTVSVIDLSAKPPRVIDHVTVPDSPEGLAINPAGNIAAVIDAVGSNKDHKSFMYHRGGMATILLIKGKTVTKLKDIEVGALPEAVCFSADGRFLYVGNYIDRDFSILRVNGTRVTDTGKRFKVPGQPASARCSVH